MLTEDPQAFLVFMEAIVAPDISENKRSISDAKSFVRLYNKAPSTLCQWNLKVHQKFSVHTMPEERKNATITCHFGFVFEKNWVGKSHDYHEVIVFKMLGFHNVFCPHENEKPHFHSL